MSIQNTFKWQNIIIGRFLLRRVRTYCTCTVPISKENDVVKDKSETKKILKVAIIGPPNAGKSTLVNGLVGRRVCSTSRKVHTTRQNIRAVAVEDNTQVVFLDTPGLVTADEMSRYKLEKSFRVNAEMAMLEADIIGAVHDVSNHHNLSQLDKRTLRILSLHSEKKSFLVLNKIDCLKSKRVLLNAVPKLTNDGKKSSESEETHVKLSELTLKDVLKEKQGWENFSKIFMVSSLTGLGVNDIKDYLFDMAVPGPWVFESTDYSDLPPEELILQTVHSKLLEHLPNEVPYNLKPAMEYFNINNDGCIVSVVLISSRLPRIQKLIVGPGGKTIKKIAFECEQDLRNTFHENIFIKLVVTKTE